MGGVYSLTGCGFYTGYVTKKNLNIDFKEHREKEEEMRRQERDKKKKKKKKVNLLGCYIMHTARLWHSAQLLYPVL